MKYTIESAKQFLKDNGYFVDNLWSVNDVKDKYDCTDVEAQSVLYNALSNEETTEQIKFAIDMNAEFVNLPKKSKYFRVSGFWKDTKEKFSDMIVKDLEEEIKAEIEIGWGGSLEFVITSYEETTLN